MAVVSIKATPPRPSVADLVARAAEIVPFVRAQAEQTENNRQVPAEAMARLRDAGLFKIMTPAVYGGYEYGFDALIRGRGPDRRRVRLDRLGVQSRHRPSVASRDVSEAGAGRVLVRSGCTAVWFLSAGRQGRTGRWRL